MGIDGIIIRRKDMRVTLEERQADMTIYNLGKGYVIPNKSIIPERTKVIYDFIFKDDEGGQAIQFLLKGMNERDYKELEFIRTGMGPILYKLVESDMYVVKRYKKGKKINLAEILGVDE